MEKFSYVLRGYNPDEVNAFLDKVISHVEEMVNELKLKDEQINNFKKMAQENAALKDKVTSFERMEENLKRAILMAERTSEQIRLTAHQERDIIVGDARKNADRIVNEALLKAETIEKESQSLQRNVMVFKRRLRDIIETQLEVIDDIEKIEL